MTKKDRKNQFRNKTKKVRKSKNSNPGPVAVASEAGIATEKQQGRKPTLAPYVDHPFPIYGKYKGEEVTAKVLSTGVIVLNETEYATPSAAARAVLGRTPTGKPLQVDGWHFWTFNQDDKRVQLSALRPEESIRRRTKKAA